MGTSVDMRTRRHADVRDLPTDVVWDEVAPGAIAVNGALAARGAAHLGLGPITIETEDGTGTIDLSSGTPTVHRRADDRLHARTSSASLSDWVQDRVTAMGLAIRGDVEMVQGTLDDFIAWEPAAWALFGGRPVHQPGDITFRHGDGRALDIRQSFTQDDDPAVVAEFLAQAGYLHIRDVFTEDEMAAVADDLDAAVAAADPDAGEAWWATLADGTRQAVRILNFQERSPALAALLDDDRLHWLAGLSGDGHHSPVMTAEGLTKPIGVADGISDLPWHKDCSLGNHSYGCCGLTVGISVTGAGRGSGALGVVPGSHRANVRGNFLDPNLDLEPLLLETATGDLTVHCSCTLHMSHQPTEVERKVVYTGFGLPLQPGDRAPEVSEEAKRADRASIDSAVDRIAAADGAGAPS